MAEPRSGSRIAAARDRFARRRWRGRLGRHRLPLAVVTVAALVGGGGWMVLGSGALDVDTVAVEGTHLVTPAAVRRAAAVEPGSALARVDLDAAAARVEQLRAVASAEVVRDWPGTLRVVVTEREAVAVVAQTGHYRGLDADGVLFRGYRAPPKTLPLVQSDDLAAAFSGDNPRGRADALREVALVVEALPATVAGTVDHVEVASLDAITLVLSDGARVRWGSAAQSVLKADVLGRLMAVHASTYDVSVPGFPTTTG